MMVCVFIYYSLMAVANFFPFILYREDFVKPGFWSRVCLHNMAKLAKEATTVRRVLESLFRYFDSANLWSPQHGLALPVLLEMQMIIENLGIYLVDSRPVLLLVEHTYIEQYMIGFSLICRAEYTLSIVHFSQAP